MSIKEKIKSDIRKTIKKANKELNSGNIEEARKILKSIERFSTQMNNYCREEYKKALIRAGLQNEDQIPIGACGYEGHYCLTRDCD